MAIIVVALSAPAAEPQAKKEESFPRLQRADYLYLIIIAKLIISHMVQLLTLR